MLKSEDIKVVSIFGKVEKILLGCIGLIAVLLAIVLIIGF
jgi:cell division protein FtsL